MSLYEIDLTVKPANRETGLIVSQDELSLLASLLPSADVNRDRDDWLDYLANGVQALDLTKYVWEVKDQTGPSCTSNQAVGSIQLIREKAGLPRFPLSAASVFSFVGGRMGSTVKDNLDRLVNVGCVPESLWPSDEIYRRSPPPGFDAEAPKFRTREPYWCPDFDTATWQLLSGYPIGFGVDWGGAGHSIIGIRVRYDSSKGWGWDILNSWGASWGNNGIGTLWERQISSGIRSRYGAVAYRYAVFS